MANVLSSASKSTVSLFDAVGQTFSVTARAVDWVDTKVAVWHKGAKMQAELDLKRIEAETLIKATAQHAEFLSEHAQKLADAEFAAYYAEAEKLFA